MRLDVLLSRLGMRRRESRAAASIHEKYAALKTLTSANNEALERLADLQRTSTGEFLFDAAYIRDVTSRALALGHEVVDALAVLSDGRERRLGAALERVATEVQAVLTEHAAVPPGPYVLHFEDMKAPPIELVGAKVRRLADMRNGAGVPVPDGFSVTSAACYGLLAQEGLWASIQRTLAELTLIDKERLARASERIRAQILDAPWPAPIAAAILGAHEALVRRAGRAAAPVSVRSSAVGEDGEFSFAGQYVSVLNVDRGGLLGACKEVVASQFGPRAVVYYKARGLEGAALPMAVGVVLMIDARASGVLYTRAIDSSGDDSMVLSGSWGLGPSTVDGSISPDVFRVARDPARTLLSSRVVRKPRMLLSREEVGVVEVEVPSWMREQPCLTRDQITRLADYGARLEQHFGVPQDVEWAIDPAERVVVLQSRPLRTATAASSSPPQVAARKGLPILLGGGIVASPGIAAGPVAVVTEGAAPDVPHGAVVVARTAAPTLAAIVDRAAAIVTEVGSVACHLATVAREFGIPAIVNAEGALATLHDGQVVTVDAEMGNIYAGRIESLLALAAARHTDDAVLQSPLFRKLQAVLRLLAPLNLTDPRSRQFTAAGCRTLHDILRYAHERAVQEMFLAGGSVGGAGGALTLESALPLEFRFVDLGGGLDHDGRTATVRPEQFRSLPLQAIWSGLAGARWGTDSAAGVAGLGSVMLTALTSRPSSLERPEPNFVIVTDTYVNINFRFGYHFARVDASVSPDASSNYASVVFHGGAADNDGRTRRLEFIAGVLEPRHWVIARRDDALFGRVEGLPAASMARELEVVGRLMVLTRQLDTRLADPDATARAIRAFQAGDDTLGLDSEARQSAGHA